MEALGALGALGAVEAVEAVEALQGTWGNNALFSLSPRSCTGKRATHRPSVRLISEVLPLASLAVFTCQTITRKQPIMRRSLIVSALLLQLTWAESIISPTLAAWSFGDFGKTSRGM